MKKMKQIFQAINKGKCKIYKIIELATLTFIISFYFEQLCPDTAELKSTS